MKPQEIDLAILGAGPAGLAAALAAAPSGRGILIIDEQALPGGQIWRQGPASAAVPARHRLLRALSCYPNVKWSCGTRMMAAPEPGRLRLERQDGAAWTLRYETLVLAHGARELLLPFHGWTTPGVTGAGGLQALIKGGIPVQGQDIIVAGSGPLLLAAADTARRHGARIHAIVEQADSAALLRFTAGLCLHPGKLVQAARFLPLLSNTRYLTNSYVEALTERDGRLAVDINRSHGRTETLICDRLASGFGLVPAIEPAQALGCDVTPQGIWVGSDQQTSVTGIFAAGECTGVGGADLALATGRVAGLAASGQSSAAAARHTRHPRRFAALLHHGFALRPELLRPPEGDVTFCRCEDIDTAAVACRRDWRDAKLHTRCGMGACQGRLCGTAARLYWGWDLGTPRPPLGPARLGSLLCDDEAPISPGGPSSDARDAPSGSLTQHLR